jgi:hydroxymethylglutaryl-CoA synthase
MTGLNVGIVGYGAYVPAQFLEVTEIDPKARELGLSKKAVAQWDEDSVTMAVEAGQIALNTAGIKPGEVGAVYVGSESPPYAVNPSSTIVADVLGIATNYRAADLQFACKAATAGVSMAMAEIVSGQTNYGLIIGTDKAQAKPGEVLEWSAGAAAGALVVGREGVMAEIEGMVSYSTDTPDFWRRSGERYPQHAGRFTGEPGYLRHVVTSSQLMMDKLGLKPNDFNQIAFHMPNGKFPIIAATRLGFVEAQWKKSLTVTEVGNPYSASALLGLVAVLDQAQPGEKILVTAYGSGAGADSMVLNITKKMERNRWGGLNRMLEVRRKIGLKEYQQMRERE